LIGNLGDDRAFEHVGEHEAGMAVRPSLTPWRHVHDANVDFPTVHGDVRKIVLEDGGGTGRPALVLSSGSRCAEHCQCAGKNIATFGHGLIIYPGMVGKR